MRITAFLAVAVLATSACGKKRAAPEGPVDAGEPVSTEANVGSLDKSLIQAEIKKNLNKIKYCYEKQLVKSPALQGKLTVDFVVAKDGTVASAVAGEDTLGNDDVRVCVLDKVKRLEFPAPKNDGIVKITYPFLFQPGS